MKAERGSFSVGSTGVKTVFWNDPLFEGKHYTFTTGPRLGVTETGPILSIGSSDLTRHRVVTGAPFARSATGVSVVAYNAAGSKMLEGVLATSTPGQFTVNITFVAAGSANYPIYVDAIGI